MAPPRKSATVESETTVSMSSRSSRTVTDTKGKSPAKTAKGSMARSRSQSGSRASTSGRSPGRPPHSPGKEHTPRKASRSPANKATAKSPARRSPARKSPARKSPAKKSPARKSPAKKSPSRTTGRTRSPTKTTQSKSPARKSPGRKSPAPKSPARKSAVSKSPAKKTPAKTARAASKSPARTTQRKKSVSPAREKKETPPKSSAVTPSASLVGSGSESSGARRRSNLMPAVSLTASVPVLNLGNSLTRRATTVLSETTQQVSYGSPPLSLPQRSSQRIATMQSSLEEEHRLRGPSTSKKHLELVSKGGAEGESRLGFSRLRLHVRVPAGLWATCGALFWLAFLPVLVVLLYVLCRKEQCTVMKAPLIPTGLAAYFHWKLYPGYVGFLLIQALVQALPLGRRVQGFPSKALKHRIAYDYTLNGWVNLLVTVGAFGALAYYGFPVTIPYRYSLQLLLTTLVVALVLALALYIKGRWAPWEHIFPPGNTGNWLHDFVTGRELSPRIRKSYDLAALCFRCGLLTWVVLLGSMAWQEYKERACFDYGFALSATCQFLYICMMFIDEEYYLSSAFVTEEGLGYVSVMGRLVLMPFLSVLPPKFLLEQRPPTLPLYCLASIAVVFLLGLVGMHLSHKRKYLFRRNWPDPTSRGQGIDFLADGAGNRLLMSGLWGFVRHPNYLADLLCHLAFALPCGHRHLLPYYSVLLSVVFLAARAVEVERKCHHRYGDLWTSYTEQVKKRLVPYIF